MAFKIDPSVLNSASLRLAVVGNNFPILELQALKALTSQMY